MVSLWHCLIEFSCVSQKCFNLVMWSFFALCFYFTICLIIKIPFFLVLWILLMILILKQYIKLKFDMIVFHARYNQVSNVPICAFGFLLLFSFQYYFVTFLFWNADSLLSLVACFRPRRQQTEFLFALKERKLNFTCIFVMFSFYSVLYGRNLFFFS